MSSILGGGFLTSFPNLYRARFDTDRQKRPTLDETSLQLQRRRYRADSVGDTALLRGTSKMHDAEYRPRDLFVKVRSRFNLDVNAALTQTCWNHPTVGTDGIRHLEMSAFMSLNELQSRMPARKATGAILDRTCTTDTKVSRTTRSSSNCFRRDSPTAVSVSWWPCFLPQSRLQTVR